MTEQGAYEVKFALSKRYSKSKTSDHIRQSRAELLDGQRDTRKRDEKGRRRHSDSVPQRTNRQLP